MLQIVYRYNFGSRPTLLFAGNKSDIADLLRIINDWADSRLSLLAALETNEYILEGIEELILEPYSTGSRSAVELCGQQGIWMLSSDCKKNVVDLLHGLIEAGCAAHQYLESSGECNQILCSLDEYPQPKGVTEG